MTAILDWVGGHEVLLGWLSAASVLMFFGSLIAVPWLVIRIPTNYFVHRQHVVDRWRSRHPLVRIGLLTAKNLCGLVLVLAGIAMLVLPGQGILTILVGLMCLDFPGKYGMEQRLVRQRPVLGAINWMRAKGNRPALELPEDEGSGIGD
jgi:hypothetical protein